MPTHIEVRGYFNEVVQPGKWVKQKMYFNTLAELELKRMELYLQCCKDAKKKPQYERKNANIQPWEHDEYFLAITFTHMERPFKI